MSFSDIFKKNFLENFSGTISFEMVIVTLLIALLFSKWESTFFELPAHKKTAPPISPLPVLSTLLLVNVLPTRVKSFM